VVAEGTHIVIEPELILGRVIQPLIIFNKKETA